MRKMLLAAVALGGFIALATPGAIAAPSVAGMHLQAAQSGAIQVDYWEHGHRWHHRRYDHGRWHYWN